MRFSSAREAGLTEDKVARIEDGYARTVTEKEAVALKLTDAVIGGATPPDAQTIAALKAHYTDAEIVEMTVGVGLFLSMSKVLITLGLEPEAMDTTLVPTPGS